MDRRSVPSVPGVNADPSRPGREVFPVPSGPTCAKAGAPASGRS